MKGRNSTLIQLRNQYLIKRYYLWYELERMRHDDVLELLSTREIFLDTTYIMAIIRQNTHLLKEIKKARPSAKDLDCFTFGKADVITDDLALANAG